MIRRSLELTEAQWQQLEQLAAATGSEAQKGPQIGQPSWRTLIRRIAEGEFEMNPYHLQAEKRKTHRWLNSLRLQPGGDIEQSHKNYIRELINKSDDVDYLIGLRDLEPVDIEAWLGDYEKENAV